MAGSPHAARTAEPLPLIAHVVYRFDTGGLENGVVNLINHWPAGRHRHAVVALTEVVPHFSRRIRDPGVEFVSLHKPPGQGFKLYPRLFRLFRDLRPAIVHTRNLAALECQLPALLAGVPARVHGEHGRDVEDLDGSSLRHQWMRRAYRPFVQRYVALSHDLDGYLQRRVGVPAERIAQIHNGVDTDRFHPAMARVTTGAATRAAAATAAAAVGGRAPIAGCPFGDDPALFIVGTVGRMQAVKAQTDLARAFVLALAQAPALRARLRLAMVGSGPLREESRAILAAAGAGELAWLPGERADVPDVMRGLDCFALPSLAEGISNTILEAMASGLPVLATAVGGNAELVVAGGAGAAADAAGSGADVTGLLTPPADVQALAVGIVQMASDPQTARSMGAAGRLRVERRFSLPAMVAAYAAVYDSLLPRHGGGLNPTRS